ncbi:MAG TPA: glycoside hydrolase family 3 C-terminal domain-containing protein [Pilimelia sp.]|nr:glycoside hydrolase family 3 C-terminal domain-containing protein [Pilimelia sp.]
MAEQRHAEVIAGLDLAQKASLTSGSDLWHTTPVPAAGIPRLLLSDGPHGLRKLPEGAGALGLSGSIPATCFVPAVGLGSSWNPDLARAQGAALGAEARAEKVAVVLGPGVNIKRSPLCGRNFEYFSEDPFLSGVLGAAWVDGVQSQGVGASVKHFAANNQETDRMRVSAMVDTRTLREIYLPAFEHVVKGARPLTVMCAYNKINGTYASENRWLLTELLRDEWDFDGLVMSDWGAVNDRARAVAAGLDLKMPTAEGDDEVVAAVRAGELDEAALDRVVDRLLTLVDRTRDALATEAPVDHDAHHRLARAVALECAVLLKNEDGILPLEPAGTGTVGVIGEFARTPRFQGSGSSQVVPTRVDNALDAINGLVGDPARVRFAAGFDVEGAEDARLLAEAVDVARAVDRVVVFLGLPPSSESEGFDRTDIELPANQLSVLDAIAAANPQVVVVLSNGSLVSVSPWQDKAKAILEGWLLGQAGGSAVADLLFGRANPSGRLAETIPLRLRDHPSHPNFPGAEGEVVYGERVYVGYRYFDTLDLPVAYPFGFGLSYTTFEYSRLSVEPAGDGHRVSFTVTNTGSVAGADVAQVYVHEIEAAIDRPAQELKGFAKVRLEPGASRVVTIDLDRRAFAYWSPRQRRWVVEAGDFEIRVGASSRDIRLRATVTSPGDGVLPVLTGMSLLSEWLSHPVGAPILLAALTEATGGGDLAGPGPVAMRMALGTPLIKIASYVPGLSPETVDRLVESVRESAGRLTPLR